MGGSGSADEHALTPEYVEYLTAKTHFHNKDIIILSEKYIQLTEHGKISRDDFIQKLHIQSQEIGEIMYKIIDTDGNETIDFEEFVTGLDLFLPESDIDARIRACFDAYNTITENEPEPVISRAELRHIIEVSLANNVFVALTDEQLNILVEKIFRDYGVDQEDGMTYKTFRELVRNAPAILTVLAFDVDDIEI